MPTASIALRQLMPSLFTGDALAVGGALQRGVVHQKHHVIAAQFGIALKHPIAMFSAFAKRSQCVFGGQSACAAVGDPAWIRPGT
jgi:hypothetical protein